MAKFAAENGMEVFYQAVEQNYNTAEDARWFETSENWPTDTPQAVALAAPRKVILHLKREADRAAWDWPLRVGAVDGSGGVTVKVEGE